MDDKWLYIRCIIRAGLGCELLRETGHPNTLGVTELEARAFFLSHCFSTADTLISVEKMEKELTDSWL